MDWNRRTPDETLSWLQLALVRGLRARDVQLLLAWAGSPAGVLRATNADVAAVAGNAAAEALAHGRRDREAEAAMRWLGHPTHHLVAIDDPLYPPALLELGHAPHVLYVEGRLELLAAPAVAIVGSRNASAQGIRDAEAFARALSAAGIAIVSGLALGIDAAAHRGGLAQRGASLAILGNGPDIVYPAANAKLAAALAAQGCIVSEFPLGTRPLARNFPRRNRLISGMSRGVLVVEAGLPSGSLNTACLAAEQGRDVFALPGSIHSPLAKGCHWLIQQGAKLVESADDVMCELGWQAPREEPPAPDVEGAGDPILDALGFGAASLDQVAARTGMAASSIAARMSMLEMEGRVVALAGGAFQRVQAA